MKQFKINKSKTATTENLLDELIATNNSEQAVNEYYERLEEMLNLEHLDGLTLEQSDIRVLRTK